MAETFVIEVPARPWQARLMMIIWGLFFCLPSASFVVKYWFVSLVIAIFVVYVYSAWGSAQKSAGVSH